MVLTYFCWKRRMRRMAERRGEWHNGEELQESAEAQAEKIIGGELKRKGWTEDDLRVRRK